MIAADCWPCFSVNSLYSMFRVREGPFPKSREEYFTVSPETKLQPGPAGRPDGAAPVPVSGESPGPRFRSAALADLMQSFRRQSVPVLAWKARPGCTETFSGRGDTDLLVAAGQYERAAALVRDCGFRQIRSSPWRAQPFVSDWFRVDPAIGSLIHVQLYEKLLLGSAFDAQIEVPGAQMLFERVSEGCPHEPSAADAAVLRLCRASLARPWNPGRGARGLLAEALELARQASLPELEAAAALFPPDTARVILKSFSGAELRGLRRQLGTHRSPLRAGGESLPSRILAGVARWNRATLRLPVLSRRQLSRPAPVIAVIGSDGSGKSTVARMLATTLHEKLDARFCYFGTGDGPSSWYRKPLVVLKGLRSWAMKRAEPPQGNQGGSRDQVPGLARALWAVAVGMERSAKMKRVRRAAAAGWIVVTDRYPQIEIPGIHDGPRLNDWIEESGVRGFLSRWENKVYRSLADHRPSLVLHLAVSPETAQRRRPQENSDELVRRVEVAAKLRFGDCPRAVIDADQALDEVFGTALETAFRHIAHGH